MHFGVDIGGTTVKIGLFETSGVLLDKWEIQTRTSEGGRHILEDIAVAFKGNVRRNRLFWRKSRELEWGYQDRS